VVRTRGDWLTYCKRNWSSGGQLSIEVIELPKRLNDENVHATRKIPEDANELLLPLIEKKEHSKIKEGIQVMLLQESSPVGIEVDSAIFPMTKYTVIDANYFPDDKIVLMLDLYA